MWTIDDVKALGDVGVIAALDAADGEVVMAKDRARNARATMRRKLTKRLSRIIADIEKDSPPDVMSQVRKVALRMAEAIDIDQDDDTED